MRDKKILLSFAASFCLLLSMGYLPATAQELDSPNTATLVARKKIGEYDNYVDATFSFEFGINGEDGKLVTRNDWDLLFGNNVDSFDVTMVTDDRSRIVDLGEFTWDNNLEIPQLLAHPEPAREKSVEAIVGHMYLVHTKDMNSDLYALFRVEVLEPGKSVTISWKLIPSPVVNESQE